MQMVDVESHLIVTSALKNGRGKEELTVLRTENKINETEYILV